MADETFCVVMPSVTHDDGGCAHNHVVVLNHDNATGKALTTYRTFYQVVRANNELLAEQGERWQRLPVATQQRTQDTYWASTRGELEGFDQLLGDRVQAALDDQASTDMESFGEHHRKLGSQCRNMDSDIRLPPTDPQQVADAT